MVPLVVFFRRHLSRAASLCLMLHCAIYLAVMIVHSISSDGFRYWFWVGGFAIFGVPCMFGIRLQSEAEGPTGDDGQGFRSKIRKWYDTKNVQLAVMISILLNGYSKVSGEIVWYDLLAFCSFFITCALWAWCYCPPALVAEIVNPLFASSFLNTIGFLYEEDPRGLIFMVVFLYSAVISFVPRVPAAPPILPLTVAPPSNPDPSSSAAPLSKAPIAPPPPPLRKPKAPIGPAVKKWKN